MIKGLPSPKRGAADVAKLTTGIGAAVMAILFPSAAPEIALAAPALPFVIDKMVERTQQLIVEALRRGNIQTLSEEQFEAFVPMTYRVAEAVKQGEYDHTLKILAAFMAGELGQEIPEAANFSRMVHRLEGVSANELRLVARITSSVLTSSNPRWVSLSSVKGPDLVAELHDDAVIVEGLHELSRRGLLIPLRDMTWAAEHDGFEPSETFYELVTKAGSALDAKSGVAP